ncbi:hypothetical protein FNV62_19545 [Streptomyces sp. RLB3-17]|nr:hypothetical protein FNV67_21795 [Streptomyces sp. S1D4-20]QDN67721.1 hypothetical protein FNV66_20990 [Streptomyces sp. S1D4-14]QDN78009.1 hypothetical protein FNV64_22505 [Streptomyces sp. S1A1-7]QDN87685.1 hypothetical protein FNV61_20460 [Streptomyces sp. RLB3-6]QDN98356.1 hypothetical protein FNV58_22160 [Streptomyces sp. RLB1-9]QDO08506.1 hypothetical protein FNV68_21545 [Streptomyces sp. S1D4-23]QDO20071.1 hypothetical protein FNV65_20650 [Streptomyces sp. S1A1-8]QDO30196.1 hypothe
MRRCHLGGGSGVRLAHDPQSSIDRLCQRLRNEKSPRTGGDAAPMPTTGRQWSGLISAAR